MTLCTLNSLSNRIGRLGSHTLPFSSEEARAVPDALNPSRAASSALPQPAALSAALPLGSSRTGRLPPSLLCALPNNLPPGAAGSGRARCKQQGRRGPALWGCTCLEEPEPHRDTGLLPGADPSGRALGGRRCADPDRRCPCPPPAASPAPPAGLSALAGKELSSRLLRVNVELLIPTAPPLAATPRSGGAGAPGAKQPPGPLQGQNFSRGQQDKGSPARPAQPSAPGLSPLSEATAPPPLRAEQTFLGEPPVPAGRRGDSSWSDTWTEGQVVRGPVLPATPPRNSSRGGAEATWTEEGPLCPACHLQARTGALGDRATGSPAHRDDGQPEGEGAGGGGAGAGPRGGQAADPGARWLGDPCPGPG
ncbi:basic salivary proline-rich protein 3-like [Fukomys damarensis]|uniref:basic salivary proline-rich protein 3-like n=1 Tax=Fukomys damarensis TaxID=885580 RepID=UPI00145506A4|nr:basic salivary proline-rich protein 3-like [Fukomys damarensis]